MSNEKQQSPTDAARPGGPKRKPLFGPNRSGVGFHPYRWEGWLIIVVVVSAILTVVVLFRTGVL